MNLTFTALKRCFYASFLISVFYSVGLNSSYAQTEPEYIQGWKALEEAEFHFDVLYAIVKCSPDSKPMILLNAFNEGGNVDSIGFTLDFTDGNGKKAQHIIEKFDIEFADMQIASCTSDEYKNLKLDVPEGLDVSSLSIKITYNK